LIFILIIEGIWVLVSFGIAAFGRILFLEKMKNNNANLQGERKKYRSNSDSEPYNRMKPKIVVLAKEVAPLQKEEDVKING